ncbi:hypothetical protein AUI06_00420 [archaeon 13_2_20CM_2_52_21]|nr:MAG: hypothetical protein AUI06_00420 [archaeon 13_2_20CM_2_52_21]OLD08210.1 MAG: hypothetical protein AUI95_03710 [Crenarchaeota archaeon 13_1_40CM_3_52_4]
MSATTLEQACTEKTRLNSGENVPAVRENSSPRTTFAPRVANAKIAAKEPIRFISLRRLPTEAALRICEYGNLLMKKVRRTLGLGCV